MAPYPPHILGVLARPFAAYSRAVETDPFRVNAFAGGLTSAVADLLRQLLEYFERAGTSGPDSNGAVLLGSIGLLPTLRAALAFFLAKFFDLLQSEAARARLKNEVNDFLHVPPVRQLVLARLKTNLTTLAWAVLMLGSEVRNAGRDFFRNYFDSVSTVKQYCLGFALLHPVAYCFFANVDGFVGWFSGGGGVLRSERRGRTGAVIPSPGWTQHRVDDFGEHHIRRHHSPGGGVLYREAARDRVEDHPHQAEGRAPAGAPPITNGVVTNGHTHGAGGMDHDYDYNMIVTAESVARTAVSPTTGRMTKPSQVSVAKSGRKYAVKREKKLCG